jgi:hypothetical protein
MNIWNMKVGATLARINYVYIYIHSVLFMVQQCKHQSNYEIPVHK